jgi:hypothetical protein
MPWEKKKAPKESCAIRASTEKLGKGWNEKWETPVQLSSQ